MTTLAKTGLTELTSGQATPETTVNEGLRHLDAAATRYIIEDRDLTAAPGTCADGACYLVKATATGTWAGKDGKLAKAVGTNAANGWLYSTVATEGMKLYVKDEDTEITHNGTTWATGSGTAATECIIVALGDETTALTTGTAKVTLRMPYAFTLTAVRASVTTVPTGSTIIVDINEGGVSILSTKLSIDASEKTSTTAVSAVVISDASLADDAEITFDIDQVGSTIAGAGLKVYLIGHQ